MTFTASRQAGHYHDINTPIDGGETAAAASRRNKAGSRTAPLSFVYKLPVMYVLCFQFFDHTGARQSAGTCPNSGSDCESDLRQAHPKIGRLECLRPLLMKALLSWRRKMPRHNRSVTARRSPKPGKRATVAGLPVSSKSKAELFDRLQRAFEVTPQVSETPQRTRERYIDAIDSLADYLESIGADAVWVEHFDELRGALEDLVEGKLPAILRPEIPKI
jgi:hypothetical protein